MMRFPLVLLALLLGSSLALADDSWTLTTADFRGGEVLLKSVDATGITVAPLGGGAETAIAYPQFLDVTRQLVNTQSPGEFVLRTVGGDRIGGEPIGIKGNDLLVRSPILGDVPVPMRQLIAMTAPGALPPESRQSEDVVTLANGDTLRGILTDITGGKISVQTESGVSSVPVNSISQINFAAAAGKIASEHGFRIRFDDGSSFVAGAIKLNGDKLDLTLAKDLVKSVDLARVAAIEQVNGPVSWLSSRPTLESVYIPFVGSPQTNAARMDRNWTGQDPIRFNSREFAHGIGVHSYSRLSWALDGNYIAFRTTYAIDTKDANPRADVTVRIKLDDKIVYEKPHVRAGTLAPVIVKDLGSAKKLTLEVDYGDNMDTQDRLNWIEPALVKTKPADTQPGDTGEVQ